MNVKTSLIATVLCATSLLGKPPRRPAGRLAISATTDETVTVNGKKPTLKTYGWLAAATVGLAGTLYLYRTYNNYSYLKVRFANLTAALETYKDEIDVTCFNINSDETVQTLHLRDILIEKYRNNQANLATLKKAIPKLKAQFIRDQQEVITSLKERGKAGQKELKEAFNDVSIEELYSALLTTFDRLEQQIPYVESLFLLENNQTFLTSLDEEYSAYLNAENLDTLCSMLMENFDRSTLAPFTAKALTHKKQLQKEQQTAIKGFQEWPELNNLYYTLNNDYSRLADFFTTLLLQIPYIHGALFVEENPEVQNINDLYALLADRRAFNTKVYVLFETSDYPFISLHTHLTKRIAMCNELIRNLPGKHAITGHHDTETSLREHLTILEALFKEVYSSPTYRDEQTAYEKNQEMVREIREEEEQLRRLKEKRRLEEARIAHLRSNNSAQTYSAPANRQEATWSSSLNNLVATPYEDVGLSYLSYGSSESSMNLLGGSIHGSSAPNVGLSSLSYGSSESSMNHLGGSIHRSSAPSVTTRPTQVSVPLTDLAGRTRIQQVEVTNLMQAYNNNAQVQQVLHKVTL